MILEVEDKSIKLNGKYLISQKIFFDQNVLILNWANDLVKRSI